MDDRLKMAGGLSAVLVAAVLVLGVAGGMLAGAYHVGTVVFGGVESGLALKYIAGFIAFVVTLKVFVVGIGSLAWILGVGSIGSLGIVAVVYQSYESVREYIFN
jgi:hypothetical protein